MSLFAVASAQRSSASLRSAEAASPDRPDANKGQTAVAEGEYALVEQQNGGAVGPFGEEVYDFREAWTLSKTAGPLYELTGERAFRSADEDRVSYRFQATLNRDLTMLRMTAFTKLRWRPNSGPLTCEFRPRDLHCNSNDRSSKDAIAIDIPSDRPYGLLWPISVFSISGIARQAERDPQHPTPIELISITQPSASRPIDQQILDGELQYLGDESLQTAGMNWNAHKFSFHIPSAPQLLLWTSSKGLLLAFTVAHSHPNWANEGLRLVRFRSFGDF